MLDIGTGQPSGILRDLQADAVALAPQADVDSLEPPFSRGIPDAAAWGRRCPAASTLVGGSPPHLVQLAVFSPSYCPDRFTRVKPSSSRTPTARPSLPPTT